jgi:hypothetical protein
MLRTLLIPFLLSFSMPALAIYKCESGGKVSYRDSPCPSGKVTIFPDKTDDNATAANAAKAKRQLTEQKNEAARLEKARHRREAIEEKEQRRADKIAAAKRKTCASLARHKKWSDEDAAAANGRAADKAKIKARRANEKYEAECKAA